SQVRIIPRTFRTAAYFGVIVVGDVRDVRDARIGDVDSLEVAAASSIPRDVGLAVTKRAPSISAAEGEADAKVLTAKPGHQGRRVHRTYIHRSGNPGPVTDIDPAAVVIGREAPGRIVNPGPAPGADPCPVPVAIGSPPITHVSRHPDRTICRNRLPCAVVVKILITDNAGR